MATPVNAGNASIVAASYSLCPSYFALWKALLQCGIIPASLHKNNTFQGRNSSINYGDSAAHHKLTKRNKR
jgi:hypothetical protein